MNRIIPILIGSQNDKAFLDQGLNYLDEQGIKYAVIVTSTHRNPDLVRKKINNISLDQNIRVIIAGAATATGLPGIVAGYLEYNSNKITVLGVRFSKQPGPNIIEDSTFNLSSMPSGVPLAYTGFNEKGFLHACMLASKILNL